MGLQFQVSVYFLTGFQCVFYNSSTARYYILSADHLFFSTTFHGNSSNHLFPSKAEACGSGFGVNSDTMWPVLHIQKDLKVIETPTCTTSQHFTNCKHLNLFLLF